MTHATARLLDNLRREQERQPNGEFGSGSGGEKSTTGSGKGGSALHSDYTMSSGPHPYREGMSAVTIHEAATGRNQDSRTFKTGDKAAEAKAKADLGKSYSKDRVDQMHQEMAADRQANNSRTPEQVASEKAQVSEELHEQGYTFGSLPQDRLQSALQEARDPGGRGIGTVKPPGGYEIGMTGSLLAHLLGRADLQREQEREANGQFGGSSGGHVGVGPGGAFHGTEDPPKFDQKSAGGDAAAHGTGAHDLSNGEKIENHGTMNGYSVTASQKEDVKGLSKAQVGKYAAARAAGFSHAVALSRAGVGILNYGNNPLKSSVPRASEEHDLGRSSSQTLKPDGKFGPGGGPKGLSTAQKQEHARLTPAQKVAYAAHRAQGHGHDQAMEHAGTVMRTPWPLAAATPGSNAVTELRIARAATVSQ